MYAYLAAGRLVSTDVCIIDNCHGVMQLPNYHDVNSIAVFLTGSSPHPEGTGTSIYIAFPSTNKNEPNWIYVGYLTNEKPSAFFKMNQLKSLDSYKGGLQITLANSNIQQLQSTALIYLSIESLNDISTKASCKLSQNNEPNKKIYQIQHLIEDFYNYACSFSTNTFTIKSSFTSIIDEQKSWIPMDCLTQWFNRITNKLSSDPNYLSEK